MITALLYLAARYNFKFGIWKDLFSKYFYYEAKFYTDRGAKAETRQRQTDRDRNRDRDNDRDKDKDRERDRKKQRHSETERRKNREPTKETQGQR